MPTYEYRCPNGHHFERIAKMSESATELPCPECGQMAARQISGGAALVFKGSGFYLTDYGRNAHRGEVAAKGGESKGGESKGGESKGGESNGGESKGGESRGGESKGGESKGGESKPTESKSGSSSTASKKESASGSSSSSGSSSTSKSDK